MFTVWCNDVCWISCFHYICLSHVFDNTFKVLLIEYRSVCQISEFSYSLISLLASALKLSVKWQMCLSLKNRLLGRPYLKALGCELLARGKESEHILNILLTNQIAWSELLVAEQALMVSHYVVFKPGEGSKTPCRNRVIFLSHCVYKKSIL